MRSDWRTANTTILLLSTILATTRCDRLVYETRSREEIKAFNVAIRPLADEELIIPKFDGKHAIPVVRFIFDHFTGCEEYVLYNNGDVLINGELMGHMPQGDIRSLIHKLNIKGLFGVTEKGIYYKLAGPRRMSIFELLLPRPFRRTVVPAPVIDGQTHTIHINLERYDYYISFYAISYYVESFPTCQDVHILDECIIILHHMFREFEKE